MKLKKNKKLKSNKTIIQLEPQGALIAHLSTMSTSIKSLTNVSKIRLQIRTNASEAAVPGVADYNDRKHCRNGATFIQ